MPRCTKRCATEALPKLARRRRPLRVWSAACSSGAELYSLAILLAEAGLLEDSFLLGSDCRQDAIEEAAAALYNSHDLGKIAAPVRRRYFDEAGGSWRPIEPLRRHVHWKVADLGRGIEQGPWDMILWRNMAIYLKAETAASVWQRLASALATGGRADGGQGGAAAGGIAFDHGRKVYLPFLFTRRRSPSSTGRPQEPMVLENSKMKLGVKLTVAFVLGLLIIGAVGFQSYRAIQRMTETNRWVIHTHEVLEKLEHVQLVLTDAETGERGFVLTGEDTYLEPYNAAIVEIEKDIESVTSLTQDNPEQQRSLQQLQKLSREKLDVLQEAVQRRREAGLEAALTVIRTDRGKASWTRSAHS